MARLQPDQPAPDSLLRRVQTNQVVSRMQLCEKIQRREDPRRLRSRPISTCTTEAALVYRCGHEQGDGKSDVGNTHTNTAKFPQCSRPLTRSK